MKLTYNYIGGDIVELYEQMVLEIIRKNPQTLTIDADKIRKLFESECYRTLEIIQRTLKDDSLSDKECLKKIEQIVSIYEEIGSGCGTRHDFG